MNEKDVDYEHRKRINNEDNRIYSVIQKSGEGADDFCHPPHHGHLGRVLVAL